MSRSNETRQTSCAFSVVDVFFFSLELRTIDGAVRHPPSGVEEKGSAGVTGMNLPITQSANNIPSVTMWMILRAETRPVSRLYR